MKKKRKISSVQKVLLSVLLLIVLLAVGNYLLVNRLERYLQSALSEKVTEQSDGLYSLSFDDLSISFMKGELRLKGVVLSPDTLIYRELLDKDSLPSVILNASVGQVDFEGINLAWMRDYTRLRFSRFRIQSPSVKLYRLDYSDNRNDSVLHRKTIYDMFSPYVNELAVKNMNVENVRFEYAIGFLGNMPEMQHQEHGNDSYVRSIKLEVDDFDLYRFSWNENGVTLESGQLDVSDMFMERGKVRYEHRNSLVTFTIDQFGIDNAGKKYTFDDVGFNADHFSVPLDNGLYTLHIDSLNLSRKNLLARNIWLESAYPMLEFAHKHPRHADWFDVKVGELLLNDIDISKWLDEQQLHLTEGKISRIHLQNFKNQQIAVPHIAQPMIYEGLQKAPILFNIDRLNVEDLLVEYYELAKNGREPGLLSLNNMNGSFTGLTNIVSSPEQFIHLSAEGKLMDNGLFAATWMLPVSQEYDRFLLHAHVKEMNLSAWNKLLIPLAGIGIEEGMAHDVAIYMDANSKGGAIQLSLPYRGLKVETMKYKQDELVKNGLVSFLANAAIKTDNPDNPEKNAKELRESHLRVVRDPYHSTFNYLWQLLRPALAESVGISEKKQHLAGDVVKVIDSVKNFFRNTFTKDKDPKK